MPDPELIAKRLARCVELFRDPDAKQVQKAEFRALLGLLKSQTVVITDSAGQLLVNGVAVQGKGVGSLIQRIGLHNVGEITIQPHAPASDVFELLTALSDQPALGTEDIPTRLRHAGVNRVTVAIADLAPPARVSGPASRVASESDDVLGELERNPQAPDVARLLDALVRQVETAFKAGRFEQGLTLVAGVALGLEQAVPALARQLEHPDDRVRKAVALALAKIGTGSAAEPLLHALRDRSPEVRMQVALGIGGLKAGALAMPLVVAMEEEQDEAVERELILALGRIGSPDAVLALIKVAQPAGRFFGRKPTVLRAAAVEALRLAGTAAAIRTLQGLGDDSDAPVNEAPPAALVDVRELR